MRFPSVMLLSVAALVCGCDHKARQSLDNVEKPPAGLTREQAAAILAKVGDKLITVGDFAAALERLGEVDRLRFKSPEKRKELLQELIDMELLAQEARNRGLDKEPAVQEGVRQILREAMLAKAHENLPTVAEISAAEVAAHYQAHRDDYEEPERRRVSAIILEDPGQADELLTKVQKLDKPAQWGELYFEASFDAPKERDPHAPADLAGDLGLVGPPGDRRGKNDRVPEAVQQAAFALAKIGDVYAKPVKVGERYYLVRLTGMSKGHTRTLAEAERSIRIAILQRMVREREQELEAELRKRFGVRVADDALAQVELPGSAAASLFDGPTPAATASSAPTRP